MKPADKKSQSTLRGLGSKRIGARRGFSRSASAAFKVFAKAWLLRMRKRLPGLIGIGNLREGLLFVCALAWTALALKLLQILFSTLGLGVWLLPH